MIDIEQFVKDYFPKIKETGLAVKEDYTAALESMKEWPKDMIESLNEDELISFLFSSLTFTDAFMTDFEGLEYEDFFKRIQDVSDGELAFSDVHNTVTDETFEKGEGTSEVSFKYNGMEYNYTASFYYDWFDTKIIHYLNTIFEEQDIEKRLIIFGDVNCREITFQKTDFVEKFKVIFPMLEVYVA